MQGLSKVFFERRVEETLNSYASTQCSEKETVTDAVHKFLS